VSAPTLAFYQPGGTVPLTSFTIAVVTGSLSAVTQFELWNANGASSGDAATEIYLEIFEQRSGETTWTQLRETTMHRWMEIQVTGATGTATPWTKTWTPVGQGRPFLVPPIPFNSGRQMELRANFPGSAGTDAILLQIVPHVRDSAVPVGYGSHIAGFRGISTGLGDGLRSEIIRGGALTASGTPDSNVQVGDTEWVYAGVPHVRLAGPVALSGSSASGALVSGEAYWATLSLGASGLTVTKSASFTTPLTVDQRPPVPGDELLLGWASLDFAGAIGSSAIYNAAVLGRFALQGIGLTRRIGPGLALVDDRIVRWDTDRPLTLPASTTGIGIYLLPAGDPTASSSGPPDPRAVLLYRVDTDSSDVSAVTDLRSYLKTRPGVLSFRFDAVLVANAAKIRTFPGDADGALCLGRSCLAILDDLGNTATAGATVFDVQYRTGLSTWVSLFTSSGAADRRPTLAYNAAFPYQAEGKPEVLVIPKSTELRVVVISIPTATAAPSGAEVQLFFEVP